MPTCREYEVSGGCVVDCNSYQYDQIMGYPTIKFFSPNTLKGDMGTERQNR